MRAANLALFATVGVLSFAVVALWLRHERSQGPGEVERGDGGTERPDPEKLPPRAGEPDAGLEERVAKLESAIAALSAEMRELRASADRGTAPPLEPIATELQDQPRKAVTQDGEHRKGDWERSARTLRETAAGMAARFDLPDSSRSALEGFGAEYARRVGALLVEVRDVPRTAWTEEENARWANGWQDLHEWAQVELVEIGGARADEMWAYFKMFEGSLVSQHLPQALR